jgi:hypothetical protein
VKERLQTKRRWACQRCLSKETCYTGKEPPRRTYAVGGPESTCEFPNTEVLIDNTASPDHYDIATESDYGLEMDSIKRPESPVDEESDSTLPSYTATIAVFDGTLPCLDSFLEVTLPHSKDSSLTALSGLSEAPIVNANSSDNAVDASSLEDRVSYEQLLDVLLGQEIVDHLIERYFRSISTVELTH